MGRREKKKPVRKSKKSFLIRLCVLAFATYIAFTLVDLQVDISLRREQLLALQEKSETQRIANKELEQVLALGTDEKYIERVAREKLGFAYPDETVLIDASGS